MMEHAYRTVNKLWDRSQPLDIEIEKPGPAYYDFVNDYPANDETMARGRHDGPRCAQ